VKNFWSSENLTLIDGVENNLVYRTKLRRTIKCQHRKGVTPEAADKLRREVRKEMP
jgi:hypothetical protein